MPATRLFPIELDLSRVCSILPDGSVRGTGPTRVRSERLDPLSKEELEGFLPFAPDFAADVISVYQTRESYVERVGAFLEYGCRLARLIDPHEETVTVYDEDGSVETHDKPETLSGEPVLPGFTCALDRIRDPKY